MKTNNLMAPVWGMLAIALALNAALAADAAYASELPSDLVETEQPQQTQGAGGR